LILNLKYPSICGRKARNSPDICGAFAPEVPINYGGKASPPNVTATIKVHVLPNFGAGFPDSGRDGLE
jgi:hypothetical protein